MGEYFKRVAEKANATANSEEAKKIRKNLIKWGGVGCGISGLFILAGLIVFVIGMFSFTFSLSVIGMFPFMIGGFGMVFSTAAVRAGLSIVIAGVTTNVLDANKRCPKCNAVLDDGKNFCTKCGYKATIECPNCHTKSDHDDVYCANCGKKLR